MLLESIGRREYAVANVEHGGRRLNWDGLAIVTFQAHLRVEGVNLGWTAVHEQEDDGFRFRAVVWSPRTQRVHSGRSVFIREQIRKRKASKPVGTPREHLSTAGAARAEVNAVRHSVLPNEY